MSDLNQIKAALVGTSSKQDVIESAIVLAVKYGPEFVANIIAVFKVKDPNLDDVEALFRNVQPYEAYGIQQPPAEPPPSTGPS